MPSISWQLQDYQAPAGSIVAALNVVATDATGAHTGVLAAPTATSASLTLNPGTYTVTVQAQDAAGSPLGPVATDPTPLVISAPATVTIQVPTNVTASA